MDRIRLIIRDGNMWCVFNTDEFEQCSVHKRHAIIRSGSINQSFFCSVSFRSRFPSYGDGESQLVSLPQRISTETVIDCVEDGVSERISLPTFFFISPEIEDFGGTLHPER